MKALREPGDANQERRLLVISPHPDDEAIFFGGTLARYAHAGILIRVLHLTTGCSNFTRISFPERDETVLQGDLSTGEQQQVIQTRRKEAERSACILGVRSTEYLPFASRSLGNLVQKSIQQHIEAFNPHVIMSFSEAGTTAHRDHSWSAMLTYHAIQAMLAEQLRTAGHHGRVPSRFPFAFRRYFTLVLPGCEQWLQKWSEMDLSTGEMTRIDVREVVKCKRAAVQAYKTQQHLMNFFERVGLLDLPQESYYERIHLGRSARGMDDLFGAWDEEAEAICYGSMPEAGERYKFSTSSWSEQFWNVIQESTKGGEISECSTTCQ